MNTEVSYSALIAAYEAELKKPNIAYNKSAFEIIESERQIYEKYGAGKPVARQLFTWCQFLRNPLYVGIYEACKSCDMAALYRRAVFRARYEAHGHKLLRSGVR